MDITKDEVTDVSIMDTKSGMAEEQTPSQVTATHSNLRTGSTRRNTPYNKTPISRRLGHRSSQKKHIERTPSISEESAPSFRGLINKTWKLYRLSPLYKFTTTSRDLRKYGASLSVSIGEQQRKSVLTDTKDACRCVFSLYKGLTVQSGDPESVQILITGKSSRDVHTTLLTAFLFGVEMQESLVPSGSLHFKHYPILMVKGPIGLSKAVTDWLENKFDCRVSSLNFTSFDLSWMAAMWSGFTRGVKSKPIELLYSVPDGVEGLSKITYTIDAEDCKLLWDSIHEEKSDEFTEDEVITFMNCLQSHFFACSRIRLSSMSLTRVGTAIAYVGNDGKIKFFAEEHVIPVLRYITELSVEKSKIF